LIRLRGGARFPQAQLGRWHDEHVGAASGLDLSGGFSGGDAASFVPWLMLNRDGLNVLLHPGTGDDYADHAVHAVWFGRSLPLKPEVFGKR